MNTNRSSLLTCARILRCLVACLAVVFLLLGSGSAKSAGAVLQACSQPNCQYLPSVISPDRCFVGMTITDPANDVVPAYMDVTSLSTSRSGETLTVTFKIRDVPAALPFNRVGVGQNSMEYDWDVFVDVDNDPATGTPYYPTRGAEVSMSTSHFVSKPGDVKTLPIPNGTQQNTWIFQGGGSWSYGTPVTLTVDAAANTMRMVGLIPGLNANSRMVFMTYDYNPGGGFIQDVSYCSVYPPPTSPEMPGKAPFGKVFSAAGLLLEWSEPLR